jgi:integrase/recombinase XerD
MNVFEPAIQGSPLPRRRSMPSLSSSACLEPVGTATSFRSSLGTVIFMAADMFSPPEATRGAFSGTSSSEEFSPSSVPVFSTSAVRSLAEAVSFSGRMGKTRRQSKTASETSKTEAFRVFVTRGQYTKQPRFAVRMIGVRIDDLIEAFAAHLADDPGTSPRTAEFYVADLREFARFLQERDVGGIENVGVGAVMEFRNDLLEGDRKRFTVYRKDAAVRRFLDWARTSTDADIDFDPIEPMHQPLDQRIVFLEEDEVDQLFSFPRNTRDAARDAAVMRLMLDTGVTVSEIRALLKSDVDLEAAQAHLGGPGSHLAPRVRRLSEETVEAVRRYLSMREDQTPELIVARAARPVTTSKTLQNAIWKRCDQVGMWRVSPMNLRHTFAIRLLRRGASLGELKDALGVRDTSNIGVYRQFI